MSRIYSSQMVVLPRLDSPSAVGLATALISAAAAQGQKLAMNGPELEAMLRYYLEGLQRLSDTLSGLLQPAAVTTETPETLAARQGLGDAWRSFRSFLSGWDTALPGVNPDVEGTRELVGYLYGQGLEFIQGSSVLVWQASRARIDGLAGSAARMATLTRLGGLGFFQSIVAAQARFGDALGLTAVPTEEQTAEVGATRDELLAVMRSYVVTAVAFVNPLRPASAEVSTALLQPVSTWESRRRVPAAGLSSSCGAAGR